MFAFLFLLMNYCKKRNLPPEEKRACELLRHNWAYHRSNHDSWTDYLNEMIEYNEKLNGETGNKFSNEQAGNFVDIMLANEFDYYFKLLDSDVPGKLSFNLDHITRIQSDKIYRTLKNLILLSNSFIPDLNEIE